MFLKLQGDLQEQLSVTERLNRLASRAARAKPVRARLLAFRVFALRIAFFDLACRCFASFRFFFAFRQAADGTTGPVGPVGVVGPVGPVGPDGVSGRHPANGA